MKLRGVRHTQYRAPETGSTSTLSTSLVACAESELREALADRGVGMARTADNHWSPHNVGSILLLMAGLEAWLNESTMLLEHRCAGLRRQANLPVRDKYRGIAEAIAGKSIAVSPDLDLLMTVRDEVAHFLPITVKEGVPHWLSDLQARGLFITSSDSGLDYDFATKLGSYALAYWAWETVARAVTAFLEALGEQARLLRPTGANFEVFRSLYPPDRLGEYDASKASDR